MLADDVKRDKEVMARTRFRAMDDVLYWIGTGARVVPGDDVDTPMPLVRMLFDDDFVTPSCVQPWPPSLVFGVREEGSPGSRVTVFGVFRPDMPHMPYLAVPEDGFYADFLAGYTAAGRCWLIEFWTPSVLYSALVRGAAVEPFAIVATDPSAYEALRDGTEEQFPDLAALRRQNIAAVSGEGEGRP